ncbi:MAG: S8 family serine peptidase [Planctomycetes bacterium]|nr:S8 family serine peptidase [Planctomycetota bacterium]
MRMSVGLIGLILTGGSLGYVTIVDANQEEDLAKIRWSADIRAKLASDLAKQVITTPQDELIPINIELQDQVNQNLIEANSNILDKAQRRAAVIALLKDHAQLTQQGLIAMLNQEQALGTVSQRLRTLWIANVVATEATPAAIYRIAQREDIALITIDQRLGSEIFPVEPLIDKDNGKGGGGGNSGGDPLTGATIECGVQRMRAPEVWSDFGLTGEGVVVGIIDTGCCITHPDLENQIWNNQGEIPNNGVDDDHNGYVDDVVGWNFQFNNNDISDTHSHGTHTTGSVAGDGTNGNATGLAPDVSMMILEIWTSFSGESTVWEAMQYSVDNGADIISVSLGWPHFANPNRQMWRNICINTIASGVVVIYAAGNEGLCCNSPPDEIRTPGDVPEIITVGATNCNDNIAGFSSKGPVTWENISPWFDCAYQPGCMKPTISAPGVNTLSTLNNCSGYTTMSGTSMATPHVAGAVALMLQANPNLDHDAIKTILMDTSVDLGTPGMDNTYGAGRVDVYEAVLASFPVNEADLDGDGVVSTADILILFASWGPCADCGNCPADFDGNCAVDTTDLLFLFAHWG